MINTRIIAAMSCIKLGAIAGLLLWSASAQALTQAEIGNLQGPERQKILEAGARKEGKVTIYSGMIVDQALRPITEAFMKKYPYIKAEYWRADSNKIVQKILAEARAKSIVVDVAVSTSL